MLEKEAGFSAEPKTAVRRRIEKATHILRVFIRTPELDLHLTVRLRSCR